MISTRKTFPTKGHFALENEEEPTRKGSRVGSLWKRFVGSRWKNRKHLKRDRSERSDLSLPTMPEILKVSPMSTSCEVTLVSDQAGPTHHITVTQNGKATESDDSYHVVLNPHRTSKLCFDEEESVGSTHDLTTEFTPSAQSSTCADISTTQQQLQQQHMSCEETIYFVRSDEQEYMRERHDLMIRKESLFYKSLFDTSDSESDDDDFWENRWQEGSSPRITDDPWYYDERASAQAYLQKQQEILNTTLETALLEHDEEDEFTLGSREEGFPIEIMVQI